MKRISKTQLKEWTLWADGPITDEVSYERILRAMRRLYNAPEGSEEDQLRDRLFKRVSVYENQEYPYGQPDFEQWQQTQTQEVVAQKLQAIEKAEGVVDAEEFRQQRIRYIKLHLKEKLIRQGEFAQQVGVDKSFVSNVLHGRKDPTERMISVLHYEYGIPVERLIPRPEIFTLAGEKGWLPVGSSRSGAAVASKKTKVG